LSSSYKNNIVSKGSCQASNDKEEARTYSFGLGNTVSEREERVFETKCHTRGGNEKRGESNLSGFSASFCSSSFARMAFRLSSIFSHSTVRERKVQS